MIVMSGFNQNRLLVPSRYYDLFSSTFALEASTFVENFQQQVKVTLDVPKAEVDCFGLGEVGTVQIRNSGKVLAKGKFTIVGNVDYTVFVMSGSFSQDVYEEAVQSGRYDVVLGQLHALNESQALVAYFSLLESGLDLIDDFFANFYYTFRYILDGSTAHPQETARGFLYLLYFHPNAFQQIAPSIYQNYSSHMSGQPLMDYLYIFSTLETLYAQTSTDVDVIQEQIDVLDQSTYDLSTQTSAQFDLVGQMIEILNGSTYQLSTQTQQFENYTSSAFVNTWDAVSNSFNTLVLLASRIQSALEVLTAYVEALTIYSSVQLDVNTQTITSTIFNPLNGFIGQTNTLINLLSSLASPSTSAEVSSDDYFQSSLDQVILNDFFPNNPGLLSALLAGLLGTTGQALGNTLSGAVNDVGNALGGLLGAVGGLLDDLL